MDSVFETVDHNKSFPARVFITQVSRCAFHWHYDYEIIFILKGAVTIYCGSEPSTLKKGDMLLFNSKVVHGIQRTAEDNLILCLQFSPQIVESNLENKQFYYHFYLNSSCAEYEPDVPYHFLASHLIQLALSNQECSTSSFLRTYSLLLSFIADLLDHVQYDIRRTATTQSEDSANEFINQILQYIEGDLRSPTLAQSLCRKLGMSEKSLYRYLKNTLGLTFKELYDIVRVEKASVMLQENKKSIGYIWENCGFSSEVSFYRNFKKQMGVTPKEYQKGKPKTVSSICGESYDSFNLGEATTLLHDYLEACTNAEGGVCNGN